MAYLGREPVGRVDEIGLGSTDSSTGVAVGRLTAGHARFRATSLCVVAYRRDDLARPAERLVPFDRGAG